MLPVVQLNHHHMRVGSPKRLDASRLETLNEPWRVPHFEVTDAESMVEVRAETGSSERLDRLVESRLG